MAENYLFPAVALILAALFGFLTLVAKNIWRDKPKTQTFAALAIIATLGFMFWGMTL